MFYALGNCKYIHDDAKLIEPKFIFNNSVKIWLKIKC